MKNISSKYIYVCAVAAAMLTSSCVDFLNKDFLDKTPDNRTELKTPSQIAEFLVNAYPDCNISTLAELSGDNFIDNNTPNPENPTEVYNLGSYDRSNDEAFAWEDVVSNSAQDSPSYIWQSCYYAIAVCNHALEAIEKLEADGRAAEVSASRGEALVARAYSHFLLVNMFAQAYKNENDSKNDLGIPYVTEPETTVNVIYDRGTVADTYAKIEKDLMDGIGLIDDDSYDIPKYHFNKRAANAFAARFYLFKRDYAKVIEYATAALGDNPSAYMRDYSKTYTTAQEDGYDWVDVKNSNNFLLIATSSDYNRIYGYRYGHNRDASKGAIYGDGPTWVGNFHPCYDGRLYLAGKQDYGLLLQNMHEMFEYTDKVAQIGYPHIVRAEFTGNETILCRAEAYLMTNQTSLAFQDLKVWDETRKVTSKYNVNSDVYVPLTESVIRNFYRKSNTLFYKELNTSLMSSDFIVSDDQMPFMQCILHFRRHETIFMGTRWFDIKRMGIEVTHNIGKPVRTEFLTWNDPRRALQLPAEVIAAGIIPNKRFVGENTMNIEKIK